MNYEALGAYGNHPEVLRAVEAFYEKIEEIGGENNLPYEQLEVIANRLSPRKTIRSIRGSNSWNNFVKDMQRKLPREIKGVGLNTRYLSTLWRQLSADKKEQYRSGRKIQMKTKAQRIELRYAISHLRKQVEDISKLGADVLIFVCDNKKRNQGGGLSSALGSPQAVRFTQWMEKHRVGFIDFKRFCKGEELFLSHRDTENPNGIDNGPLSKLDIGEVNTLSRDKGRSQLSASLLWMFNEAVEHQDKLQRLPNKKNRAEWMESRGLELVIKTPNIDRKDFEERFPWNIGLEKMKAMIVGIKRGDICLQKVESFSSLDCG